ncbi:hypothetical protein JOQ06_026131 [Pogonophryne albipinna]|uniref:C2H2-type domain-containing protein n=1 Tax=Pogonophryne albipinna TaxID=1090488 RepID=A0AAD6ACA1_9TELE|nr:hypothetical protein JOQ06_026131 [Pogonophryne albipinna]
MREVFLRRIAPLETNESMFYWKDSSKSVEEMSKCDILTGIVTEKLSTALQEILAVLQRTVSGYEEEASGLRREISQQNIQLELLKPRINLQRRALVPDAEGHVVVSSEEEQPAEQETGSLGMLWYDDDDEEEEQPKPDPKDPDFQITPRLVPPRASDRPQREVILRVCILEDSRTLVLSNTVFDRCPVQEVCFPRGLSEEQFLLLLRSSFPRLTDDFEFFTSDRTKTLKPLQVDSLTAEKVSSRIRSSNLYIRLKNREDSGSCESVGPRQKGESPSGSVTSSADETEAYSRLSPPRVQTARRRRGRPPLEKKQTTNNLLLRVCMLGTCRSDVLSNKVFKKYPVKEVCFPPGLSEEGFLLLLRSSFPRLTDSSRLEFLRTDRSRRLQRIQLETLTPEDILRTRSSGGEKTLLYLRLRKGSSFIRGETQLTGTLREYPTGPTLRFSEASSKHLIIKPLTDSRVQHADPCSSNTSQEQEVETQEIETQEIVTQEVETQEVETQEVETQEVAESSDNEMANEASDGDWKPDAETRQSGAKRVKFGGKNLCKVCSISYILLGSLVKHAWSHVDEEEAPCVCGVCGDLFETSEELKSHLKNKYKKTHECSFCRKSFLTVTGLKRHVTLHTGDRPFKCDVCGKAFAHASNLSIHRWVHREEKPYKCDVCPKAFGLKGSFQAHRRLHGKRERFICNVCGKSLLDMRSLTRHKSTHSGERRYGCEICGKRFKLPGTLRSHKKTHTVREKTFLCHICCKTFVTNGGLKMHLNMHSGERPFPCSVCGKRFMSNGYRKSHMRTHTNEAPYECKECGRFFKRKTHLNNHVRGHLGIKLFVCSVCGKACSRQEHLTVHMRTHNGERPYQCTVCAKAFTQSHCLKTHMKSHHQGDEGFLNATCP